jgi:hypothetical protein
VKKLVLAIALLMVIPVVLVGCGKSEAAGVKSSINGFVAAYNDKDYDKCTDYMVGITDATKPAMVTMLGFAREASGEIEVSEIDEIKVEGDSATAKVTVKVMGQTQTNTATLTKVDGKWKFDLTALIGG